MVRVDKFSWIPDRMQSVAPIRTTAQQSMVADYLGLYVATQSR